MGMEFGFGVWWRSCLEWFGVLWVVWCGFLSHNALSSACEKRSRLTPSALRGNCVRFKGVFSVRLFFLPATRIGESLRWHRMGGWGGGDMAGAEQAAPPTNDGSGFTFWSATDVFYAEGFLFFPRTPAISSRALHFLRSVLINQPVPAGWSRSTRPVD